MKNYYEILEVSPNASYEVIEKAYRTLAKKYHPDIQPRDKLYWAEVNFKEITEAYDVLSNPTLRKEYDMKLKYDNFNSQANNFNQYPPQYDNNSYTEYNNSNNDVNASKQTSSKRGFGRKKDKVKREKVLDKELISSVKDLISEIPELIRAEAKKPAEERSKDMLALALTLIIVAVIIFVFFKIPVLKKFLFPF